MAEAFFLNFALVAVVLIVFQPVFNECFRQWRRSRRTSFGPTSWITDDVQGIDVVKSTSKNITVIYSIRGRDDLSIEYHGCDKDRVVEAIAKWRGEIPVPLDEPRPRTRTQSSLAEEEEKTTKNGDGGDVGNDDDGNDVLGVVQENVPKTE